MSTINQEKTPTKRKKNVQKLREHLKTLMEKVNGGGFKNPFSESDNIYPYKSYAVDAAMKYFMAAEKGEERRLKELGIEWIEIT